MLNFMITDLDIQALVDGQLKGEEKNRVLHSIENHPGVRQRYQALQRQKALICEWYQASDQDSSNFFN